MSKMMAIRLLTTCIIAGLPRSPVEGIQTVPEDEAKRLIDGKMAEDAGKDLDGEEDDDDAAAGDGLEARAMSEKKLRALAAKEGAGIEGDANKQTIVAAIRERRGLFTDSGVDVAPDEALRKLAGDEKIEVADDADTAALLTAIRNGRANGA